MPQHNSQFRRFRSLLGRTSNVPTSLPAAAPKTKSIPKTGTSFDSLPAEIQYSIYLYALPNLEFRIVPEPELHSIPGTIVDREDDSTKIYDLSQASYSTVLFYEQTLFPLATTWHPVNWESHVLFIFPTILSLLDIFTSPTWPRTRITLIRRLRVYEHRFFLSDSTNSAQYDICDVLPVLVTKGLSLDILEYAPIAPLMEAVLSDLGTYLSCSPGWLQLHLVSLQPNLDPQDITCLTAHFASPARKYLSGLKLVDLPCTPGLLRNTRGEIIGSTTNPSRSRSRRYATWENSVNIPDRIGVDSWLAGQDMQVQLIMQKPRRKNPRDMYLPDLSAGLAELCADSQYWKSIRKAGRIQDCFTFN